MWLTGLGFSSLGYLAWQLPGRPPPRGAWSTGCTTYKRTAFTARGNLSKNISEYQRERERENVGLCVAVLQSLFFSFPVAPAPKSTLTRFMLKDASVFCYRCHHLTFPSMPHAFGSNLDIFFIKKIIESLSIEPINVIVKTRHLKTKTRTWDRDQNQPPERKVKSCPLRDQDKDKLRDQDHDLE